MGKPLGGRRAMFAPPDRRSGVIYVEGDRECDCCDQRKECASIDIGLVDFVWIICKDCLNEFVYTFYSDTEKRKLKLDKINETRKRKNR